jgi:spermidine synthase
MRLFSRGPRGGTHEPVEISEKHGVRYLHLGGPAVQSAMRIRAPYALELEYTRAMMAFLLFHPAPRRIALIGLGGGSVAKFIHRHLAESRLTAVEVNPSVAAAARSHFSLPADDARLNVVIGDGAGYIAQRTGDLDALLVDGYDANRIVEALASPVFYARCRAALAPGGVAAFNLWGNDRFFDTYFERIARAFDDHTLLLPAEKKGNIQLFAFQPPLPDTSFAALTARGKRLEAELGLEMPAFVARMRHFNPVSATDFLL